METFADMRIIRMKKEWEFDDNSIYRLGHYSSEGLRRYWQSIDQAVRHWDTFIASKKASLKFGGESTERLNSENSYRNQYGRGNHHFVTNMKLKNYDKNQFKLDRRSHGSSRFNMDNHHGRKLPSPPTRHYMELKKY